MRSKKTQDYYLTNFIMFNAKCDVHSIIIDAVWITNYNHFRKIILTMDRTNKIDFNSLWLSEPSIKRIRKELHKNWFIRKCKVSEDVGYAWYVNPYLFNKDNKVNLKLQEIFKHSENKVKWENEEIIDNLLKILY